LSGKKVSMADIIVLAGCAAVEKAAKDGGFNVKVPFIAGRADASLAQTDVDSFAALEPLADGFRNYQKYNIKASAEDLLIDKAQLLTLTAPEMTALIGGMRVLNTNYNQSAHGVFTYQKEVLSNDYFINLLDFSTTWKSSNDAQDTFEGRDRRTGNLKWTGTRVDLIFGSNTELRAIAEVYACEDGKNKFVDDFITAWNKVMNLGRYDLV
jgi:catalase-peroxidase